jgi:hypothetical protein
MPSNLLRFAGLLSHTPEHFSLLDCIVECIVGVRRGALKLRRLDRRFFDTSASQFYVDMLALLELFVSHSWREFSTQFPAGFKDALCLRYNAAQRLFNE